MPKGKGFFGQVIRPEDELARQRDVEALIAPRRMMAQELPIDRIGPNPFQARQNFEGLEELVAAIKVQGFITHLRVRPDPTRGDAFQLVFGERRLRAAREAGLETVPCEIAPHSDDEMVEIGLAENIQRRDLEPLEEAHAFQSFIEQRNYSIRRLAERIGKGKSYIEDRLALLRMPDDVQSMLIQRSDALRIAREITKLPTPEERRSLIDAVVAGKLNTDDVRSIVQAAATPDPPDLKQSVDQRTERPLVDVPRHQAAPPVHRAMERDVQALRTVLARLHQLLPILADADRAALTTYLSEMQREIDLMLNAIRTRT